MQSKYRARMTVNTYDSNGTLNTTYTTWISDEHCYLNTVKDRKTTFSYLIKRELKS